MGQISDHLGSNFDGQIFFRQRRLQRLAQPVPDDTPRKEESTPCQPKLKIPKQENHPEVPIITSPIKKTVQNRIRTASGTDYG